MDLPPPEAYLRSPIECHVLAPARKNPSFYLLAASSKNYSQLTIPYDVIENYYDLPCNGDDQRKIQDLVKTLATNNYIILWGKHSSRLRKVEKEIYHVHPFRFLATIHNHPASKKYFRTVLDDSLLRMNFVKGFAKKMERDAQHNNLERFLETFAKDVQLSKERLQTILLKKQWTELLDYIACN